MIRKAWTSVILCGVLLLAAGVSWAQQGTPPPPEKMKMMMQEGALGEGWTVWPADGIAGLYA
jgi:hypothetical protein